MSLPITALLRGLSSLSPRAQGVLWSALGAVAIAAALGVVTLGTAFAVALQAGSFALSPADWAALRFTVLQAALSSALSCALAVPVARATSPWTRPP